LTIETDQTKIDEKGLDYTLKEATPPLTILHFPRRIKVSEVLDTISKKDSETVQVYKMLESYTKTPVALLQNMDFYDFSRAANILTFFG